MIADLEPRAGVWAVPAADPSDDAHTVTCGRWLGGSTELLVSFSGGVGVLTPDEARTLAAVLVAAADYAEAVEVVAVDA
jgi:hypothetical protein